MVYTDATFVAVENGYIIGRRRPDHSSEWWRSKGLLVVRSVIRCSLSLRSIRPDPIHGRPQEYMLRQALLTQTAFTSLRSKKNGRLDDVIVSLGFWRYATANS